MGEAIINNNYRGGAALVTLLERCRELRASATDAESLLWRLLRNRQIGAAKFRRQHEFAGFILDFYCHEHRLAIELDGGQHFEPNTVAEDEERSWLLATRGVKVRRFTNTEVLMETEAVLESIWGWVTGARFDGPSPCPLPEGEGN